MKKGEALAAVLGSTLLICGLAGCVTTGGAPGAGGGVSSGSQDDFGAVLNDFNAMGMTIPPPYRLDGKVGETQYPPKTLGEVRSTISRRGVITATTINGVEFEVLNTKGPDTGSGLILIVQAADGMDLSKDENMAVFVKKLQELFAVHSRETASVFVRMDGRVLSLHGEPEAPGASILACEPGKDLIVDMGGGVKMELAWIPPGSFLMGSPEGEAGRSHDQGPQHQVTFSKGFWMGKYEVTQEQWERLMGRNPSEFQGAGKRAPVEQVSWDDCQKFIRRLNADLAATNQPVSFRLPTEAQWEYACRAGTTSRYNTGSDEKDLDRAGWYDANSGRTTHPVGQKQPNAWGLYDMHGNVWEWCSTNEREYPAAPQTDPGLSSGRIWKFFRGGSYGFNAAASSSAERWDAVLLRDMRAFSIGFRVVAVP